MRSIRPPEGGRRLEELDVLGPVVGVERADPQQAGQQRRAEHRLGPGPLVVHPQRLVAGQEKEPRGFLADQRVGQRLEVAHPREGVVDGAPCLLGGLRRRHADPDRLGDRQVVLAEDPPHLLDEVDLALDVEPVDRHRAANDAAGALGLEAETPQRLDHLLVGDGDSEELAGALGPHGDRPRLGNRRPGRQDARAQLAAAQVEDQAGQALGGRIHLGGVDAALEPVARVAGDVQPPARVAHRDPVEGGGLDEDVGGRVGDRGLGAALDPGNGHGARLVGDHQVVAGELDLHGRLPDRQERLTGLGHADDDRGAAQPGQVEDVRGLAQLEENEVARIHDGVAGDLADRPQPVGQRRS